MAGRFVRLLSSQQVQQVVRETYAVHFLLMNLGFDPDDIFVGNLNLSNAQPPGVHACVKLVAQEKEFIYWIVRVCPADERRFERAWREFARNQPKMDKGVLDRIVVASQVYAQAEEIVRKLLEKGFSIPEELSRKWFSTPPASEGVGGPALSLGEHLEERSVEFSQAIAMALSPEVPDGSSN